MSVHYKFKSNLNYDTVTFDGLHISVADLKKSIMQQKKIGKTTDFDLEITNAQTKEVYDNDETLVPKNTSVIVARVPVVPTNKKSWEKPDLPLPMDDVDLSGQIRFDKMVKSADIANTNATEDDKVKAMINQSSQEYDPSRYVKSRSMTGPLPPTYTCYRCGKQGHWIKNCPTNNLDIKRSTGIPRSFMLPVDGPEHKGALLTSSGDYAVPLIDHQAYKEVKKEKPPFVIEPEVVPEPEAEIPEELLCMFCKNLLQDAVLIPCCGNSFCDECVRQALLDSDNHECPVCHEIDISPDTVIPNRFLRTAVLNFKNETGYTRVKKMFQPAPLPVPHIEPQPSPDSTVENEPAPYDDNLTDVKVEVKLETPEPENEDDDDEPVQSVKIEKVEEEEEEVEEEDEEEEPEIKSPKEIEESVADTPPGTPLADEPVDDDEDDRESQGDSQDNFDDYPSGRYERHRSRNNYSNEDSEPQQITTIGTVLNTRMSRMNIGRTGPQLNNLRPYYSGINQQRERNNDYDSRGRDFRGRFDRRNPHERPPMRGQRPHQYDRGPNDRYHRPDNRRDYQDFAPEPRHNRDRHYEPHVPMDPRRPPRYISTPPPIPPVSGIDVPPPQYQVPPAIPPVQPGPALLPTPQHATNFPPHATASQIPPSQTSFPSHATPPQGPPSQASFPPHATPPQPPPPGASPVDHSSQPPPPGVGPLLPSSTSLLSESVTAPSAFPGPTFKSEESKPKTEEISIDDRMEAFQRQLDQRASKSALQNRDRSSRSSSRSRKRSRSTTRSSHSYSSSKSWSRTASRSLSRSTRSRTRTPYSSRSRTRSYSRSRSRSKSRSYSRSRSRSPEQRSRSKSRSRDRDREKRRGGSRERLHVNYSRSHSQSHSPSPRNYHSRARHSPYPIRRSYNPTPQYGGPSYSTQYAAPPPQLVPVPVLHTASYVPSHVHSGHPIQPPPVAPPIEHYPIERTRYTAYNEMSYTTYDQHPYPHQSKNYVHQRYEREPRIQRFDPPEYQRDYQRRNEEPQQRIPGWVGDRDREYKPRFRPLRGQPRKEIKELPKLTEPELKSEVRVRESKDKQEFISRKKDDTSSKRREEAAVKKREESSRRKREEKAATKYKKHHHHHSKESKRLEKQESKINPVVMSADSPSQEPCANLIKVQVVSEMGMESKNMHEEPMAKTTQKIKEKKHKHKKHKTEEQLAKKKKVPKKEKIENSENSEQNVRVKKKKKKVKPVDENKKEKKSGSKHAKKVKVEKVEEIEIKNIKSEDPDVLTVTADDLKLEPESSDIFDETADDVIKLNTSTDDLELELGVGEEQEEEAETDIPNEPADEIEDKFIDAQNDSENMTSPDRQPADDSGEIQEQEEETAEELEMDYEGDTLPEEEVDEDELHVEVPELSKWEREDFEEEVVHRPQRRSAVVIPKDEKSAATLSSDIIQRAEKVIMQKPLKTAIVLSSSSTGKEKVKGEKKSSSKSNSPVETTEPKHPVEPKSVVERPRSPNLQVTISADKEKRSVLAKEEAQQQQPRRFKLDRSSFKSIDPPKPQNSSHRTVIIEEPTVAVKKSDERPLRKVESRAITTKREHAKIHGPDHKTDSGGRESAKAATDRKHDHGSRWRRSRSKEDFKKRKDVPPLERRPVREEIDSVRTQKVVYRSTVEYERERRYVDNRSGRTGGFQQRDTSYKRSRSRSYESPESQHSLTRRPTDNRRRDIRRDPQVSTFDNTEGYRRARSPRKPSPSRTQRSHDRKQQSVIKTTTSSRSEKYSRLHDESKFEPDYDEFSDNDQHQSTREKGHEGISRKRSKQTISDSDQHHRVEKRKVESTSSSASSSSSASESEDSDHKRHKKSKHKKHKKHKHKKKKSHKSKLKE